MTGKKDGALENLSKLRANLPEVKRLGSKPFTLGPRRKTLKSASSNYVSSLPECFDAVNRQASSKMAVHVRERAALEAVASTLSAEARAATGSQAAGIYLAALVVALRQVVSTLCPFKSAEVDALSTSSSKKKLSRKQKRLQKARNEQNVQDMSAMEARTAQSAEANNEMRDTSSSLNGNENGEISEDAHFIASLVYLISLAAPAASKALVNAKAADILGPINRSLLLSSISPLLSRHVPTAITAVFLAIDSQLWTSCSDVPAAFLSLLRIASSTSPKSRQRGRDALITIMQKSCLDTVRNACGSVAVAWFIRDAKTLSEACAHASRSSSKDRMGKCLGRLLHHVASIRYFGFFLNDYGCAQVAKHLILLSQSAAREILPFIYNALGFVICIPKNLNNPAALLSGFISQSANIANGSVHPVNYLQGQQPLIPQKDAEKLLAAVVASSLPTSSSNDDRISRSQILVTMAFAVHTYFVGTPPPNSATVSVVKAIMEDIDPLSVTVAEAKRFASLLRFLVKQQSILESPDVFYLLEKLSTVKYKQHWNNFLPVFKDFLSSGAAISHLRLQDVLAKFILGLVQIRSAASTANNNADIAHVDDLLASSVRGGGAPFLLKAAPLRRDAKQLITNAWVLPILRENLRNAPLSLWSDQLSKLHLDLETTAREFSKKDNQLIESKNLMIYSTQLLSLLPSLCINPSDLGHAQTMNVAFKAIHYCLNYNEHVVQSYGYSALRSLAESIITSTKNNPSEYHSGVQASFGSRLKKLFDSILKLAENLSTERRGALLQAITIACRASSDSGLVTSLLRKALRQFLEVSAQLPDQNKEENLMEDVVSKRTAASKARQSASDVAISIVESGRIPADAQEIPLLKRALFPFLRDRTDPTLQKKAYRALTVLVSTGAFSRRVDVFMELIEELSATAPLVAAGTLSVRLSTVQSFMEACRNAFENDDKVLLVKRCTTDFLPEAVLALRDSSEKSRQAGYLTILAMGKAWKSIPSPELGMVNYYVTIAAGLGGRSAPMISGSLQAMGRFMKVFKDDIRSTEALHSIATSMFAQKCAPDDTMMTEQAGEVNDQATHVRPGPVSILLRHTELEVQRACLSVVKIALGVLGTPISKLLEILPGILPGLVATSADSKKKEIRLLVKVIIERLLRKCGREVMEANFPVEHKRLLSSVRKTHDREKAKRQERKALMAMRANGDMMQTNENDRTRNANDQEHSDVDLSSDDSDDEKYILDGNQMIADKLRRNQQSSTIGIEENPGDVIDLLASDSINIDKAKKIRNIMSAKSVLPTTAKSKKSSFSKDDNEPLVFIESDDESGAAEIGSDSNDDNENVKENSGALSTGEGSDRKRKRRGRDRNNRGAKKSRGSVGEEYRSKRGAGDVKRPGKPDPYAYFPLGSSAGSAGSKGGRLPTSGVGKGAKAKRLSKR